MKNINFIYLLLIIIFSCHKEKKELSCDIDTCPISTVPAIDTPDSSIAKCYFECPTNCQPFYSPDSPYSYLYPCFNPTNPNQLAYYRRDNVNPTSEGYELWVKDFCTGEQKMITNQAFYGLDWSTKDWLAYTATNQNIWKIKSNGDSLTQLTFMGSYNRYPRWNPNGTKIAYESEIQGSTFFYIMDEFGNHIETIDDLAYSGRWCWVSNDEICFTKGAANGTINYTELNIYNLNTEEVRLLHTINHVNSTTGYLDSLIRDIEKLPNENSIVWSAIGLVGKTDLNTGSFQVLKDKLYQERFQSLTVRPKSPEILINKAADYYAEYCDFYTDYGFFLVNKEDGSNHRRVVLE